VLSSIKLILKVIILKFSSIFAIKLLAGGITKGMKTNKPYKTMKIMLIAKHKTLIRLFPIIILLGFIK